MIEENVVSQAGAIFKMDADDIERYVRAAGFEPRRRNMRYERLAGAVTGGRSAEVDAVWWARAGWCPSFAPAHPARAPWRSPTTATVVAVGPARARCAAYGRERPPGPRAKGVAACPGLINAHTISSSRRGGRGTGRQRL